MLLTGLLKRTYNHVNKRIARVALPRLTPIRREAVATISLGNGDGAWEVPAKLLSNGPICYSFGVGLDISFDVALAERDAHVYSFDPTPRSIEFMERISYDHSRIHFFPIGVWDSDCTLRFYAPMDKSHVNYSVKNIHATGEFFEAKCKTVKSIMRELGHTHINILKLDIEGSWYEVLRSITRDSISADAICVEFDTPVNFIKAIKAVRMLADGGFKLVSKRRDNLLFVSNRILRR